MPWLWGGARAHPHSLVCCELLFGAATPCMGSPRGSPTQRLATRRRPSLASTAAPAPRAPHPCHAAVSPIQAPTFRAPPAKRLPSHTPSATHSLASAARPHSFAATPDTRTLQLAALPHQRLGSASGLGAPPRGAGTAFNPPRHVAGTPPIHPPPRAHPVPTTSQNLHHPITHPSHHLLLTPAGPCLRLGCGGSASPPPVLSYHRHCATFLSTPRAREPARPCRSHGHAHTRYHPITRRPPPSHLPHHPPHLAAGQNA